MINSCIDLIFTSQPNLVMHSGIHPLLHPNCHHQIVFCKIQPDNFIFYPQPCKRLVWHYQQANNDLIKPVIEQFDWEKSFSNLEVNKQVSVFSEAIMNNFEILLSTKQSLLMTKILPGWTNQLKHLLRKKKLSINVWSKEC